MELFFNQVINGIQSGCIYAALALGLVLIFRSTSLLNFAQGEMAMFSTFVTWLLWDAGLPLLAAIVVSMALSVVGGAVIERAIIRPVGLDNHLAVVIVTIGLFITLNAFAGWIFGTDPRHPNLPRIAPREPLFSIGEVAIRKDLLAVLGVLAIVVGLLYLLFQKTKVGLAMRAVASNRESSQLCGVQVGRMLMLGWGLSAALGALAGALYAPTLGVEFNMMQGVLIFAFAAATLGGFDSPLGAVVGGLIVGVTQSLTIEYVDLFEGLDVAPSFILILGVLLVRPQGLFGRAVVTRV